MRVAADALNNAVDAYLATIRAPANPREFLIGKGFRFTKANTLYVADRAKNNNDMDHFQGMIEDLPRTIAKYVEAVQVKKAIAALR